MNFFDLNNPNFYLLIDAFVFILAFFLAFLSSKISSSFWKSFFITIIGTTAGFALVTFTTVFFDKKEEKFEIATLLVSSYLEAAVNHKIIEDKMKLFAADADPEDLNLYLRTRRAIPIEYTAIEMLYKNKRTYKCLNRTFTRDNLIYIYRGTRTVAIQINNGNVETYGPIEAVLREFNDVLKIEGQRYIGIQEWNKYASDEKIEQFWRKLVKFSL
jgi:energy-coupling factor transporter transmembrane protein EcfT